MALEWQRKTFAGHIACASHAIIGGFMTSGEKFSIGLFCGSRDGCRPGYREAAARFGENIAVRGWTLVYGGSRIGLMAAVADAARHAGGHVIGVMPHGLVKREIAHDDLSELRIVETMSERKELMAELSDAFVVLPGGIGTMDELFEVWTWHYLGIHEKLCVLINVDGFYDALLTQVERMREQGFLPAGAADALLVATDVGSAIDLLAAATSHP